MNKRLIHTIEWAIAILAYAYLIYKFATYDHYDIAASSLRAMGWPQWFALLACVCLMPLNMLLEGWKWQTLWNRDLSPAASPMPLRKALQQVYYSKLAGLITPYRLGEYPARAILMPEEEMGRVLSLGAVAGATMTASIIAIGILALPFLPAVYTALGANYIYLLIAVLAALLAAMCLLPRLLRRWADVTLGTIGIGLGQSLLRLACWCIQLAFVLFALKAVGLSDIYSPSLWLQIAVYYLLISVTPNVPVVEVGVRGAWAIFLFGTVNAALAGVVLWVINTLLPCLCWLFIRKRA